MVDVDRIRTAAEYRGIKLGKICQLLGEQSNYLGKVQRGLRKMDDAQVRMIADYLHVNYGFLTGETPIMFQGQDTYGLRPEEIRPRINHDRIVEARKRKGLTPNYLEAQVGVPYGYLEIARQNGDIFPDDFVKQLAIALDTTYEYLMGMTDDPLIPPDDRTGVKIRVFGDVAAGIPREQIDNFDPEDIDSWEEIDRPTAKNGTYFALRIKGDSMETRIKNGDRVIVRYQETVESGQTAIVAINGDTATCKRVIWDDQGGMILMPNNPAYIPQHFTAEEIQKKPVRILGLVVEIRGLP